MFLLTLTTLTVTKYIFFILVPYNKKEGAFLNHFKYLYLF